MAMDKWLESFNMNIQEDDDTDEEYAGRRTGRIPDTDIDYDCWWNIFSYLVSAWKLIKSNKPTKARMIYRPKGKSD
jgi:hypothetical protein